MAANVTFGVELEFAFPKDALPVPPQQGEGLQQAMAFTANWLGSTTTLPVGVDCMCSDMDDEFAIPCRDIPEEAHHIDGYSVVRPPVGTPPQEVSPSDCYFVQVDESVVPRGQSGWCGLEIATPVKYAPSLTVRPSELSSFLTHMRNWEARIALTSKCGLHIHVGESSRGITVNTAKRMVTMVALLEKSLLTQLVGPHRSDNHFWMPITATSYLMSQCRASNQQPGQDIDTILPSGYRQGSWWRENSSSIGVFLSKVWGKTSLKEIEYALFDEETGATKCSLALALRYPAENEDGIDGILQPDPRKCSFEFRYPQGTFCDAFINMWSTVTTTIMSHCREGNPPAAYQQTLSSVLQALEVAQNDGRNVVPDLLQALGLGAHVNEWMNLMAEVRQGHDRSASGNGMFRPLVRVPQ